MSKILSREVKKFIDTDFSTINNSIVFLDIDGTLVADGKDDISKEAISKVKDLALESKKNLVFLCSNSDDMKRDELFKSILGIDSVSGIYLKPDQRIKDLALNKSAKQAKQYNQADFTEFSLVVIGDKYMIDGRFAKKIGAKFYKITNLIDRDESFINLGVYLLDRLFGIIYRQ